MPDPKDTATPEDVPSPASTTPVVSAGTPLPETPIASTSGAPEDREGTLSPAPEPGVAVQTRKGPVCPTCKEPLTVYVGDALHKLGTAFCSRCGIRHHLKG